MESVELTKHDVRMSGFIARKSFSEVREWIQKQIGIGPSEEIELQKGLRRILAEDVISGVDVPDFDRSAMDGYAVRAEETSGASDYNPLEFRVVGESFPHKRFNGNVGSNEAVKIMTGGAIPDGANGIMMAEYTETVQDRVKFRRQVEPGKHIMRKGEDIRKGEVVMVCRRCLRPQDLGVLASVHRSKIRVVRQPTVAILATGDELVRPEEKTNGTQIVDSNSYTISGMVERYGGNPVYKGIIEDKYSSIRDAISNAKEDMIIVSGGTSVGEEDYVPSIVLELGKLFVHGVAMKPGSPFGMGLIDRRPIFLLPGNPVAALVTSDAFVGSAIRRYLGLDVGFDYPKIKGVLKQKIVSTIGRTEFVRVKIAADGTIEKNRVSGSSILTSATRADGFLVIEDGNEGYGEGTEVEIYLY